VLRQGFILPFVGSFFTPFFDTILYPYKLERGFGGIY